MFEMKGTGMESGKAVTRKNGTIAAKQYHRSSKIASLKGRGNQRTILPRNDSVMDHDSLRLIFAGFQYPQRKPKTMPVMAGLKNRRWSARACRASRSHEPPRRARALPFSGPVGLSAGEAP